MNEFVFSQEPTAWELTLKNLKPGESLSAVRFLTLMEEASEEEVQEALLDLEERTIALDITRLPQWKAEGKLAQRLEMEHRLAKSPDMRLALEDTDPLRLYLEEVAQTPAAGDPALLAQQYVQGDETVGTQLVNLMLSRAIEEARSYVGYGVLLLDLIQEASLGLWQAIGCYRQGDFEKHCRWWIRQYLAAAVTLQAKAGGVGQKMQRGAEAFREADRTLLTELGRNPTLEEIASKMEISMDEAVTLEETVRQAQLLQKAQPSEESDLPQEEDQAVEDTAYFQMRQRIQELLSGLSERDAKLLTLRYGLEGGLPLDVHKTALQLNMTPEEVLQTETQALEKLRSQSQ